MSRLLTLKLPLLYLLYLLTECQSHMQNSFNAARFFPLAAQTSWVSYRGRTTNNPCLSVCPCHKTLEVHKRHAHTPQTLPVSSATVCDTTGPRRQETMSQQIMETIVHTASRRLRCAIEASFTGQNSNNEGFALKRAHFLKTGHNMVETLEPGP